MRLEQRARLERRLESAVANVCRGDRDGISGQGDGLGEATGVGVYDGEIAERKRRQSMTLS